MAMTLASTFCLWLFQEAGPAIGWDPASLWKQAGWPVRIAVILLFFTAAWFIGAVVARLFRR